MAVTVTPAWSTADTTAMNTATETVINDLNTNNFAGAWGTAEGTDKLYGTPSNDTATKDPLLQLMESGQGLTALDPTKNWNAQTNAQYYAALGQSGGYTGANDIGKNPYGLWGSQGATLNGTDSKANIAQEGMTPDVERFAGAKPSTSFLGKYGADIAMVALAVAAPEAAGVLVGAMDTGIAAAGAGAALGSAATGVAESALAGGLVGAGSGALMGAITGGNVGKDALLGGVGGSILGGVSQLGSTYGVPSGISNTAGKFLSNQATGALNGSPSTGAVNGALGTGNSNMMNSSTGGNPYASMFSGLGNLAGPILSGMGSNNISSMQSNAYTTAGNAANSGTQFGFNGLGGMGGSFNNGTLNMSGGSMTPAAGQFSQFANAQGGMANQFSNGNVPGNVSSAFGNFNNQIGLGQGYANAGAGSSFNMMGMGTNMLNSANANQSSAYQTALTSGQAALNPQIQQQSNALLNSNFEKGMSGTSGGALQTQALQNSFNTAELQNQNQAVGQGLNAFNSTISAGTGMFNSGAGQLGNFNNQGVNFGQTGMTGAMNYNMFSPQLAGMYQSNANSGAQGFGSINNTMLGNFNAGLGAITNQGTQMNRGAQTQASGANSYNGGMPSYMGNVLGSPGSMNNLVGGAQSLFSGMTGMFGNSNGNSNPFAGMNWGAGSTAPMMSSDQIPLDMSGIDNLNIPT